MIQIDDLRSSPQPAWAGAAITALTAVGLAAAPGRFAFVSSSVNDAWLNRPTRFVRGYLVDGRGPALVLHVVEQEAKTTRDVARYEITGGSPIALADALARRLWPEARPVAQTNPDAVRELEFGNSAEAFRLLAAQLAPNVPLNQAAAAAAGRPADSRLAALAGRYAMIQRDYQQAGRWFERAIRVDPDNGPLFNEAAYVEFFTGNLDAALRNVGRYEQIDPQGGNPPDSRGEILLMAHRYREAEAAFLLSYERAPRFLGSMALRKAAVARRASGDQAGADAIFRKFMDASAGNPAAALFEAQWNYESGREAQAFAQLEKPGSSIGLSQLAVWRRHPRDAAEAARLARSSPERAEARLAAWVSQPATPTDLPSGEISALVFSLRDEHTLAKPALEAVIARTSPAEATQWDVLLAWALTQSGQTAAAKPFLAVHPIPSAFVSLSESVVMRRYLMLTNTGRPNDPPKP